MKEAITLFQIKRGMSFLGQSLLVLFALCYLSLESANAQIVHLHGEVGDTSIVAPKLDCNATEGVLYRDDNSGDASLYADNTARKDTITICPKTEWDIVTVTFSGPFDLAAGDTLGVYDGNLDSVRANDPALFAAGLPYTAAPLIGSGSGVGANGTPNGAGWVSANCDPVINPSGCLSFIFVTNGDNRKGSGWEAWATCSDRGVGLEAPNDTTVVASCIIDGSSKGQVAPTGTVKVVAATATGCNTASQVDVRLTGVSGECIRDTVAQGATAATMNLAPGNYIVYHTLIADDTKKDTSFIRVDGPGLTCNDEVNASLGAGCSLAVNLDMLLEGGYCDTSINVQYWIAVKNAAGVQVGTGSSIGGYPTIARKDIPNFCGGEALTATVTRKFIYPGAQAIGCYPYMIEDVCEVAIKVNDNTAPSFNRGTRRDTLIGCDATRIASLLKKPDVIDNCDLDTIIASTPKLMSSALECDTFKTYEITWTATDKCNNPKSITDIVVVMRTSLFIDAPTLTKDCEELAAGLDPLLAIKSNRPGIQIGRLVNGTPDITDTIRLSETDYECNYVLTKEIEEAPSDCGKKFFVTWSVLDWCNPQNGISVLDTQFIAYTDTVAPVIDTDDFMTLAEAEAKPVSLGHFECSLSESPVPAGSATDNCGEATTRMTNVQRKDGAIWNTVGANIAAAITAKALVCDTFRVAYEASDNCHTQPKVDQDTTYFVVIDDTAPNAICTDELNVSVPNDFGVEVHYNDINGNDDGLSGDNCGLDRIRIRRKGDTDWLEKVVINCDDVHKEVLIEMGVWDKKGNFNSCWATITAEDKIAPVCSPLPNDTITCKEIHTGELGESTDTDGDGNMEDSEWVTMSDEYVTIYNTKFGNPVCEDNLTCSDLTMTQQYQLISEDCGSLRIRRRYRAEDWQPKASSWEYQSIQVKYEADWKLTFPADILLDCNSEGVPAAMTAADIINNGSCDLFGLDVTERVFEVPGDICMKIERTYEVINWCKYDEEQAATPLANNPDGLTITSEGTNADIGRFTYTQVIKLYVTEKPTVTINPVETCIYGVGDALPYNKEDVTPNGPAYECDTIRTFSATATNCIGALLTDFQYKLYVDGVRDVEIDSVGASFDYVVTPGVKYVVEFWASDGCGNSAGEVSDPIIFNDCKRPTPYTLNGLAIELGENGTVAIWANDLDQGSYDNCTPQNQLRTFITKGGPIATSLEEVLALDSTITLNCEDVGTRIVSFYVVDEAGNYAAVETFILVQRNNTGIVCPEEPGDGGMVAGRIVNPNGENIEQVSVSVAGAMQESMVTGTDGVFQFNLDMGANYTVTPVKDMNPLNGVSTFDLVLISKHILGISAFDSPYQYIAADVNKSGSITAFDMVQIRRLILNITTEFEGNDSWRFVDGKYEFTTDNPAGEDFSELMNITDLSSNMMDVDFVGVKVGDVNANASANSLLGAEVRNTNGALTFNVADQFVEAGQTVNVEFTAADIASAQGYQFTMDFAGLELTEVVEGVAKAANFNTNLANRGVLTTSWDGEATADDVLFTLAFNPTVSGRLSDLISVSSDLTVAEAYNTAGELLDVNIEFSNAVAANFELNQNTPNPFNAETVIGFNLPKAGTATLKVMDVQGKVLKVVEGEFVKGYNQVAINAKELGATGVLHYRLESADQVATKKMIIIE